MKKTKHSCYWESCENLVQKLMLEAYTLTMDETRISLLADDLQKVATSGMSSNGREHAEQSQWLSATRGKTNERVQGMRKKSRSPHYWSFQFFIVCSHYSHSDMTFSGPSLKISANHRALEHLCEKLVMPTKFCTIHKCYYFCE
jgi:hypothetical protein